MCKCVKKRKKRLEAKGWKIGTAKDFLRLSEEEVAYIELKFGLQKDCGNAGSERLVASFAVERYEDQRRKAFHGVPLRVAGPKASKSLAVSSLDRIDKCDETLPRRRMEMQSKANRSHKFSRLLVTCVLAPRSRRAA
jgi:hypothetical protein